MGSGFDGGPSKSADRVGAVYKVSGKTVQHSVKVLDAIEAAEAEGDRRRADRLTELLETKQTVKALQVIEEKPRAQKPAKVEVPRTLNDHSTKAYSRFSSRPAARPRSRPS